MILSACSQPKAPPAQGAASVDGQALTQDLLDYYVRKKTGVSTDQLPPDRKELLLAELSKLMAAAQKESAKIAPDVQHELELQRIETLARGAAVDAGVFAVPTDAELNAAYEQFKAALPAHDYHVAHILVATENSAASVIVRLQAGADFAKVATEASADDSKSRGGDIGWIAPGKLPAAFTDAVAALKVNEFTKKPVRTIYGWHVIRLLETRSATPPSFEQVKAQLAVNLQQERYQRFLDQTQTAADPKP